MRVFVLSFFYRKMQMMLKANTKKERIVVICGAVGHGNEE
jgi:hypothetical protein